MEGATTLLGQHIDPSKQRTLRVFLLNFVPIFAFLGVFVSLWFYFVDRNLAA